MGKSFAQAKDSDVGLKNFTRLGRVVIFKCCPTDRTISQILLSLIFPSWFRTVAKSGRDSWLHRDSNRPLYIHSSCTGKRSKQNSDLSCARIALRRPLSFSGVPLAAAMYRTCTQRVMLSQTP